MTSVTTCRYCGQPIRMIKNIKGKSVPVDAEPVEFVPDLNSPTLYYDVAGSYMRGAALREDEREATEIGYKSHAATCPSARYSKNPRKSERKQT